MTNLYLYGIIRATVTMPILTGITPNATPYGIIQGALQAVVSDIDAEMIQQAVAAPQENIEQLTRFVQQHDKVISTLLKLGTVLPTSFGTILTDETALRNLLVAQQGGWTILLQKLDDCIEMGVKAFVDHEALEAALSNQQSDPAEDTTAANYLLKRKAQLDSRKAQDQHLNATLSQLHETCAAFAEQSLVKAIPQQIINQDADASTDKLEMRTVYLIKKDREHAFRKAVQEFEQTHEAWLYLMMDGPFAPYHFVGGEV